MSRITKAAGKALALITGAPGDAPALGAQPRPRGSFMRGGRSVTFGNWKPAMREAQDDISDAWDMAAARMTDAIQNSGWLSGGIEQAVSDTVGTGLRLKAMPENTTFGMSEADARDWAQMVERRFELWARSPQECDIEGKRNFGQMQAVGFSTWLGMGEILAEFPWRRRPWNTYGTKIRMLPPTRLSRQTLKMDRLINGVYTDADGMPIAFLTTKDTPLLGKQDVRVRARDNYGRQRVILVHVGAPGTYRGISPMTPALQVARQFDQLADATLTQSILKTLFAATITGDEPTAEVMAGLMTPQEQAKMMAAGGSSLETYLEMIGGFYEDATIDLGMNGRIAHMFPGQELKFHTTESPSEDFKTYVNILLREMARGLGLTFEGFTLDYTGATYSSVRMATSSIWSVVRARRENIVVPFCQAAYEAWLEEEIETGRVPFPGGIDNFLLNRVAASRAEWRGSPKPQADDLKTAKAHEVWRRLGVITDEQIANDLGTDIEDVYAQRSRETDLRRLYNLPEPELMGANGGGAGDGSDGGGDPGDGSRSS